MSGTPPPPETQAQSISQQAVFPGQQYDPISTPMETIPTIPTSRDEVRPANRERNLIAISCL